MSELLRINYDRSTAVNRIASALFDETIERCRSHQTPVIVNVGATSSTGDAVGPFVGWFLKRKGYDGRYIGDLESPVHGTNLSVRIDDAWACASQDHASPFIIAVDAAVGKEVGRVTVNRGALQPGAGVGKSLPSVGDVHIMACTTETSFLIRYVELDKTVAIAEVVADAIIEFYRRWNDHTAKVA
jgi:putative sporulation protein YyaC